MSRCSRGPAWASCPTGQVDKMKSPFEWDIVTRRPGGHDRRGLCGLPPDHHVSVQLSAAAAVSAAALRGGGGPRGPARGWAPALWRGPGARAPGGVSHALTPPRPQAHARVHEARGGRRGRGQRRQRVLRGNADNDMVKIENLTKVQALGGWGRGRAGVGALAGGRGLAGKAGPGAGGGGAWGRRGRLGAGAWVRWGAGPGAGGRGAAGARRGPGRAHRVCSRLPSHLRQVYKSRRWSHPGRGPPMPGRASWRSRRPPGRPRRGEDPAPSRC